MTTEDTKEPKQKRKFKRALRINDDLYDRLATLTKRKGMTISSGAEQGIQFFLELHENDYESVMEEISKQSLLKLNKDNLSKMLKLSDEETREAIVKILQKGQVTLYEGSIDEIERSIPEINREKPKEAVAVVRIPETDFKAEVFKLNDKIIRGAFGKIANLKCKVDEQMLIDFSMGKNTKIKISLFVLKKYDENG
ncbi:MAG: hypothetical protein AABX85_04115, partial [Nanoarchaeota archaeon]